VKRYSILLTILLGITLLSGCFSPLSLSEIKDQLNPTPMNTHSTTDPTPIKYDDVPHNINRVLVRIDHTYREHLDAFLAKSDSHILNEWSEIGWFMVSVPTNETPLSYISKLRKVIGVSWAEPEMEYEIPTPVSKNSVMLSGGSSAKPGQKYEVAVVPDRPQYGMQWGHQNINSEAAWEITTGDPSVIVAIVDTGVDKGHPEFVGKTFVGDYNAIDGSTDVTDNNGHGTHVAGIAADDGLTGEIAGVAWQCPIMPVRVMNNAGEIYNSYLIEAMLYLADYANANPGVRIVANMSIGGRGYSYAFKDAIDAAAEKGVLLVTSAGNDYKRIIGYPSCFNGVVDVAASDPYDRRTDFSTIGPWTSLAAPGTMIYSTVPGGAYESWDGTSMASPFACGAAALVLSAHPGLTPLQIKNQLEQTAQGAPSFNEELGYGVMDIAAAVGALEPMIYGSLDVTTNIISTDATGWLGVGVISIYDSNGLLAGFGTTGENANYLFHALKPGTYRVQVVYYDVFDDLYRIQSKSATVARETTTAVDFDFAIPVSVTTTPLEHYTIDQTAAEYTYHYQVDFTVATEGCYDFITSSSGTALDTAITLYDAVGNELAYNDDHEGGHNFSRIIKKLPVGTYTVVVETWDPDEQPILTCNLDINSFTVTY
jgi:hypothetical protein